MYNMLTLIAGVVVAGLYGCASGGGGIQPQKIGDDTYMMLYEIGHSGGGADTSSAKVSMFQQANSHCTGQGKKMERVSDSQRDSGTVFPKTTVELQYKCVAK